MNFLILQEIIKSDRVIADLLEHGVKTIGPRWRKVSFESELSKELRRETENFCRSRAGVNMKKQRDQTLHDERIAVGLQKNLTVAQIGVKPHLRLTAAHNIFFTTEFIGKRRQGFPHLDQQFIAIFPFGILREALMEFVGFRLQIG